MKIVQLEPDVISFSSSLSACAKESRWLTALQHLQWMRLAQVIPNVVTFTAAITACEGHLPDVSLALFDMMFQVQIQPNEIAYTSAISACAADDDWWAACSLLEEMNTVALEPGIVSYGAVLKALPGRWLWAAQLLRNANELTIRMNEVACTAAIAATKKTKKWKMVLQTLQDVIGTHLEACQSRVESGTAFGSGFESGLTILLCLALQSRMQVMQMQLNNRDWPVLCAEAEWEMVDENQAMALVAFPEENSGPTPISWAARLLGAPKKSQVSAIEGKVQATKEKAVKSQVQVEEQELPDPKELAREARSKHVTTGGGQTLRSNTQCEWKTVVAEEDDDVSHLQMLRKAPVRERGSGKCQVKGKASKAMKSTKSADQDRDGKKVQEHPQSKKQTSRIDIREGLNIMGFA
eukprot:g31113.t1